MLIKSFSVGADSHIKYFEFGMELVGDPSNTVTIRLGDPSQSITDTVSGITTPIKGIYPCVQNDIIIHLWFWLRDQQNTLYNIGADSSACAEPTIDDMIEFDEVNLIGAWTHSN
jgi:hypothetical protein